MKILFCTNKFDEVSNGPAKFANLILKINELYPNHEIRILTEDIDSNREFVYKLNLNYPKILEKLSQFIRIFAYHYQAKKIKREFDFDVIIYNNAFIGLLSAVYFTNTIGMINDDNNLSIKLKQITNNYESLKKNIFKNLEFLSTKFHNKIIFNSKYLYQKALREYLFKGEKAFLLYKGVDLSVTKKQNIVIDYNLIKILFVKTDFERGGLNDLITAIGDLEYQFELKIIGVDHTKIKSDYHLENYKNIKFLFLGQQNQKEVEKAMIESDIFCVPSKMEALGVANIEAMAIGLPIVSTNVGGIPEVLDYGNCGFLAKPSDPLDLAQKIKWCIEDDLMRKQKVSNALEFVKKFDINLVINNFLNIIKQ